VRWAHEEAIEQVRAGAAHHQREAVLEWARLADGQDEGWRNLTDAEREIVLTLMDKDKAKPKTTAAVDRYLAIEAELKAFYNTHLRPGELEKIRRALVALRTWLEG
jgi:hypothetical protein